MHKFDFFIRRSATLRLACGVSMFTAIAYLVSGIHAQSLLAASNNPTAMRNGMVDGLPQPYAAPGFTGIEAWLNSQPLSMEQLKGKVVLVDFWTYACINCVRTLPHVTELDRKYHDQGLVIIGVHAPEFEAEKNIGNIKAAIARYGIKYPVAVDNRHATWANYNNHYWPAQYLINREGQVVYTHFGEGNYDVTDFNIRKLLAQTTQ